MEFNTKMTPAQYNYAKETINSYDASTKLVSDPDVVRFDTVRDMFYLMNLGEQFTQLNRIVTYGVNHFKKSENDQNEIILHVDVKPWRELCDEYASKFEEIELNLFHDVEYYTAFDILNAIDPDKLHDDIMEFARYRFPNTFIEDQCGHIQHV